MSTPFQNRIVGTVIVAAVAIIFLPDFLDGNKKKYNAEFENIPQSPQVELNTSVKAFPTEKLEDIELKSEEVIEEEQDNLLQLASEDKEDKTVEDNLTTPVLTTDIVKIKTLAKPEQLGEEVKKTEPKPDINVIPKKIDAKEAWVIQLGSFRHEKNVSDLVAKLKYHGYTTFTRPIKTKNGVLTKVFIGPDISKSSLESKINPLKQLTHVEGKVTRFYPTK
ncbi:SPOR domain-containing protein [Pseudocolwellia sp. HL-MZ19]|uniref:SPOR domain-containing protein n=1 Tax=unclassified Pseudocolwellia TaxID=2848178 RepID=UPI003CE84F25